MRGAVTDSASGGGGVELSLPRELRFHRDREKAEAEHHKGCNTHPFAYNAAARNHLSYSERVDALYFGEFGLAAVKPARGRVYAARAVKDLRHVAVVAHTNRKQAKFFFACFLVQIKGD